MFSRNPKEETHPLDDPIDNLIRSLAGMTEGDEIHTQAVVSLKTLMELRAADKAAQKKLPVNPDVLVAAGAHLLGIAMILGFEKANVLTSKSLSFVPKIRV